MSVAITDAYRNVEVTGTGFLQENGTTTAKEVGATLTINAGLGISLVTDPETNKITIVNTGTGTGAFTTITDVNSDATYYPIFTRPPTESDIDPSTGTYQMNTTYVDKTNNPMTYNPYTGTLTCAYINATVFGNIIGQTQGNADSATKLLNARAINGVSFDGTADISFTTDAVAEGTTNQYFTTARARASISAGGNLSYNAVTGVVSYTTPTTDGITEGTTNRYFTDARARSSLVAGSNIVYTASSGTIALANSLTITGGINAGSNTFTKIASSTASGNVSFDNGTTNTPGIHFYYDNNTNFGIDSSVYGSKQAVRFTKNLDETGGTVVAAIDVDGLLTTSSISTSSIGATSGSMGSLTVTDITNTLIQTSGVKMGYGTFAKIASATTGGNMSFDGASTNTPGVHFYYADNSNFGIDSSVVGSKQSLRFLKNLDETGGTSLAWLDTDGLFSVTNINTNLVTATGGNFGGTTYTKASAATTSGNVSFDSGSTNSPGVHFYHANNSNFGIDSGAYSSIQSLRFWSNLDETGATAIGALDATGKLTITGSISTPTVTASSSTITYMNTSGINAGSNSFAKVAGSYQGGNIAFDNGSTNVPGVHFYYDNNANFGIDSAVQGSAQALRFVKNLDESGGTVVGYFDTNSHLYVTGNIYSNYSDERLKVITGRIENAVDKVCAIDTFYYKPNDIAISLGVAPGTISLGVGAGSVNKVAPEAVGKSPLSNEYLTVQYERLVPLLIEAIKEHENTIKELKEQINKLNGIS